MPVITVNYKDLEKLSGMDRKTVIDNISMIGAEVERVEEESVDLEFFPNRPDLYSVEGVSRAIRAFMGAEPGLKRYDVAEGSVKISVSEDVLKVRPVLGCAVVRGLKFDSDSIKAIMDLQEDLHWALGRDRKKVSIGVHDMKRIQPPFAYGTEKPSYAFVPLDHTEKMTMTEILEKHAKGVRYAHLVKDMKEYPIIKDAKGDVLSFPPIINGTLTSVTESTTDIFIDVTGTAKEVYMALNIVVAALAERGGKPETVTITYPDGSVRKTPDLTPIARSVTMKEIKDLSGISAITPDEVVKALRKMGHDVSYRTGNSGAGKNAASDDVVFDVLIPAYRPDIMHNADIIEDVAIGYGYAAIAPCLPETYTVGKSHRQSKVRIMCCETMTGLGYSQVMPFTLTCDRIHFENMQRPKTNDVTYVLHPISEDQTMVRTTLLPGLLEILALNRHRELPQRIFEVGDAAVSKKNRQKMAAVSIHYAANFTEIAEVVDAFFREMKIDYEVAPSSDPAFLEGRRADILVGGKVVGVYGEFSPAVIRAFELGYAVVGFEVDLTLLF